jgi:hypothetical protein
LFIFVVRLKNGVFYVNTYILKENNLAAADVIWGEQG